MGFEAQCKNLEIRCSLHKHFCLLLAGSLCNAGRIIKSRSTVNIKERYVRAERCQLLGSITCRQTAACTHLVMSPVVINLRSSLSTATAADLKIPPPDASGFNPPPSVVFGSFIPCNVNDLRDKLLPNMHPAGPQHVMRVPLQSA